MSPYHYSLLTSPAVASCQLGSLPESPFTGFAYFAATNNHATAAAGAIQTGQDIRVVAVPAITAPSRKGYTWTASIAS